MAVTTSVPETRELRGIALFRKRGEEIEPQGRGWYRVPGCSGGTYTVYLAVLGGEEYCECPDFGHRERNCKHIYAATLYRAKQTARRRREAAEARRERRIMFSPAQISANLERMGA